MKRSPWHLIIIRISHWCCRHHKEFCHCCRAGPWSRGWLSTLHGIAGRCLSLGGSVWKILSGEHFNWGNVSMPKLLLGSFQRICWPFRSVQEPIFSEGCSTWDAACMLTELLGWEFAAQFFVGKHEIKEKLSLSNEHWITSASQPLAVLSCWSQQRPVPMGLMLSTVEPLFFFAAIAVCHNNLGPAAPAQLAEDLAQGHDALPVQPALCHAGRPQQHPQPWGSGAADAAHRASIQHGHVGIRGSQLPQISFPCCRRWLSRLRYQRLDGLSTGRFQTAVCLEKSYWR